MREIEHGSFSPLVFSAAGGMGPSTTVVYKRLASLLAEKQGRAYSSTLHWLRCRLTSEIVRNVHSGLSPQYLHPHPLSPLTWPFMKARYQHFKPPQYHFLCVCGVFLVCLLVCFVVIYHLFTRCYNYCNVCFITKNIYSYTVRRLDALTPRVAYLWSACLPHVYRHVIIPPRPYPFLALPSPAKLKCERETGKAWNQG